ncbi:MAG: acyltransferase [Candidatus Melainabacteria bacterium]|nr:acyltransferase [Candidatus Melainabacteria bacterium]
MSQPPTAKFASKSRLDALTGLRIFAAFLIVVYHGQGHFTWLDDIPQQLSCCQAVSFFFILSGFILSYVYSNLTGFDQVKDCWIKRVARIWPLHIAIFIIRLFLFPKYLLTFPGTANATLVTICNLAMLHAWIPLFQFYFSYNAPSWSISTEFFFYLVFPLLLPLVNRKPLITWIGSLALTVTFIYFCNVSGLPELSDTSVDMRGMLYISPFPRLFEFLTGMCLAKLYRERFQNLQISASLATLLELGALLLSGLLMWHTKPIAHFLATSCGLGTATKYWCIQAGAPIIGFAAIIFLAAINKGVVSKFLSIKPLVFLGEISFAMYLLHHPLLCYHGLYLPQFRNDFYFLLFLVILTIGSHFLFRFVETPMRQLIVNGLKIGREQTAGKVLSKSTLVNAGEMAILFLAIFFSHPQIETANIASIDKRESLFQQFELDKDLALIAGKLSDDRSKLILLWKTNLPIKTRQILRLDYLDQEGKILASQQLKLTAREIKIKADTCWLEEIDLIKGKLASADSLALTVYDQGNAAKKITSTTATNGAAITDDTIKQNETNNIDETTIRFAVKTQTHSSGL